MFPKNGLCITEWHSPGGCSHPSGLRSPGDPRRPSKSIELAERELGLHYSGPSGALARRQGSLQASPVSLLHHDGGPGRKTGKNPERTLTLAQLFVPSLLAAHFGNFP